MRLAWDRLVQFVNGRIVDEVFLGNLLGHVEVVFGSTNKVGTLVKGGCVRVGDRVYNLDPEEITEFRIRVSDGIQLDLIKEISEQVKVPYDTLLVAIKLYLGLPVETTSFFDAVLHGAESKAAGSLPAETGLIRESGQDLGSNVSDSEQTGSTLQLGQQASGEVIQGSAKDSESGDPLTG